MNPHYRNISIKDYSYDLPPEIIAKYPLPERDRSKLLVWNGKSVTDRIFRELPSLVDPEGLMVFNNTRVIRARLLFRKETGAEIEIFCLEPHDPADFARSLSSGGHVEWKCLVGNLKRWKMGPLATGFIHQGTVHSLNARRIYADGDAFIVRFSWDDTRISFAEVLESMGHMPIPPYLDREDEESDATAYQTIFARESGSVAAPTAGLHFTPAVMEALDKTGIERAEVTLHVSAGTFRPVKSELIGDHMMHTEHFFVSRATLERLRGRKILAVGTTTVRTLESLYWLGVSSAEGRWPADTIPAVSQWEPYESQSSMGPSDSIDQLLAVLDRAGKEILEAKTDIIIVPGYRFRMIHSMVTNFHQPQSTLLLLVAAFTGKAWRDIYSHALSSDYRFLSYGDSMLLAP
ncbi:MAG: S-adenosylmethionine:tRNA ribosyltransferase-isomerase [Bacteroidales bacterium]